MPKPLTKEEAYDIIEGEIAAHDGGATVVCSFDDATFNYTFSVKGKMGWGKSLASAIQCFKDGESCQ